MKSSEFDFCSGASGAFHFLCVLCVLCGVPRSGVERLEPQRTQRTQRYMRIREQLPGLGSVEAGFSHPQWISVSLEGCTRFLAVFAARNDPLLSRRTKNSKFALRTSKFFIRVSAPHHPQLC